MHLQTELVLAQSRLEEFKGKPSKEDPKITLKIRTALTREVAEAFGCRDIIFAGDVPRCGIDKTSLEGGEIDCTIRIEHDSFAFTVVANSIGNYVAKFEGDGPKLLFDIKIGGHATTVADMVDKVKIDPFEITLKPAQRDLGLKPGQAVEAGESASDTEDAPAGEAEDGATMAPAAVMGGTHQRGRKKNRPDEQPAPPALEPPAEEEDLSFMEAPVVQ